jgi:hypothetical protein
VKAEVAQALQRMLINSQRRAAPLVEVPGISEEWAEALSAAGLNTLGELVDVLEAEPEEEDPLAGVPLDAEAKSAVIEAARAFESAPEPEPEESDELLLEGDEQGDVGEGEPEVEEGGAAAEADGYAEAGVAEGSESEGEGEGPRTDAAAVTETPEK